MAEQRALDANEIIKTLTRLEARIGERFPGAGLARVCGDLVAVAKQTSRQVRAADRPFLLLRTAVFLLILSGLVVILWAGTLIDWAGLSVLPDAAALTQGLEAAANLVLLAGAGTWFLLTHEERIKRGRIFARLHELRSLAHIIDMHQLTKDPTVILSRGRSTASSPQRPMSRFELTRYLEYCAEMLALVGKLSALYAEHSRDTAVIVAVTDIEQLTSDLGRKIWQKITILSDLEDDQSTAH